MFNLGAGEIAVLVLLGLIFIGPRMPAPDAPRWSWSDWLLLCAALALGATALQLLFAYQR